MQSASDHEQQRQPGPELVTAAAAPPSSEPEQLLIRMLEVVCDRVESIHAGQRAFAADLREIRANLSQQRRPASKRTEEIHMRAVWARRNGLCPRCQVVPVVNATGRLPGSDLDHFYGRDKNDVTQTWIICRDCNDNLNNSDFKAAAEIAL